MDDRDRADRGIDAGRAVNQTRCYLRDDREDAGFREACDRTDAVASAATDRRRPPRAEL